MPKKDPTASWEATVRVDESVINDNGLTNRISTTKYSLLSWLPKSFFEQFRRFANIYFLMMCILMIIGEEAPYLWETPLSPWPTVGT